jgi:hypothetical protein
MAIYTTATTQATSASCTAGVSVDPSHPIPDNCHTVIIYNEDAANVLLVNTGVAGGALPQATSINIPTQASMTLSIGVRSERVGAYDFIYDCTAGTATARISYICGINS